LSDDGKLGKGSTRRVLVSFPIIPVIDRRLAWLVIGAF
jgi:hypothetical protein